MKKFLACTAAVILAASMMTACGGTDTSSSTAPADNAATTTTAAAEESKAEETTTAAAEESKTEEAAGGGASPTADTSKADESAAADESKAEESAAEGGDTGATEQQIDFVPIDKLAEGGTLKNIDNCSLKFNLDTDVNQFVEMFNEDVGGAKPGDENYEGDEALINFSVQEVSGVPMLKCDEVLFEPFASKSAPWQIPKIRFDMNKLFKGHEDDMEKIFTIKADVVCIARDQKENDDGTMLPVSVLWYGGAFGTNNNNEWNGNLVEYSLVSNYFLGDEEHTDWKLWANQWAYTEIMGRPGLKDTAMFKKDYETNYVTLMAWKPGQHIDLYIADLVFEDEDGNIIAVPEENIPGGASYEQEDNKDVLADGILTYEDGTGYVYEGQEFSKGDVKK